MSITIIEIVKNVSTKYIEKDVQNIRKILLEGGKINCQDTFGLTALHWASYGGNLSLVEILIMFGADPKINDKRNYSPLHLACLNGHTNIVEYLLLEHNLSLQAKTVSGCTPFLLAAMNGHNQIIHFLLLQDPGCVNHVNKNGDTALHFAAANNHYKTVEILLKNGAYIDKLNLKGNDALDLADKFFPNEKVVNLLSEAYILLNHASKNTEIVNDFSEALKNCSFKSISEGNTILHYAIINNNIPLIKSALKNNVNLFLKNLSGKTAFVYSEKDPKVYILLLIKKGFDFILEQDIYFKKRLLELNIDVVNYIDQQLKNLTENINEVYHELKTNQKILSYDVMMYATAFLDELIQCSHFKQYKLKNNNEIKKFYILLRELIQTTNSKKNIIYKMKSILKGNDSVKLSDPKAFMNEKNIDNKLIKKNDSTNFQLDKGLKDIKSIGYTSLIELCDENHKQKGTAKVCFRI